MKDGKCNKKYPKPFQQCTSFDKEGYVHYRRRASARHTMQSGVIIDNRYVVPYNRRLCSRFCAHINVEYRGWNMMIKYLFKYVSKGVERVRFAVQKNEVDREANPSAGIQPLNEVHNFVDGRYIFLHEAAWRILNFYIHQRHPPVLLLPVHLHNMQHIVFKENSKLEDVLCQAGFARTPLLGWFDNNARDPKGHELTYLDYPKDYKWDGDSKQWG